MSYIAIDDTASAFIAQSSRFKKAVLEDLGLPSLDDLPDPTSALPVLVPPIMLDDFRSLTRSEKDAIGEAYWGRHGAALFVVGNPDDIGRASHPLLEIAEQVSDVIPVKHPMTNPMEGRPTTVARFGPPDGTLKIFNLESAFSNPSQRNLAETSDKFDAHNDGLGFGGAVEVFALYAEAGPLWGGMTYFQNMMPLVLHLARIDPEAFESLFLPDAITALRPHGAQPVKITTPVLFINDLGKPQIFYRLAVDECDIIWRPDVPALARAAAFLEKFTMPFSPNSTVVNLNHKGIGAFARNHWLIHGRTPFIDGRKADQRRVLSRKWFASAPEHLNHKHVPGMHILPEFAELYPDLFGPDMVSGSWYYDAELGRSVRRA